MSNHERTKQRALERGRKDALSGQAPRSMALARSMWDKYYWEGYDRITVDRRAQTVQAVKPKTQ